MYIQKIVSLKLFSYDKTLSSLRNKLFRHLLNIEKVSK